MSTGAANAHRRFAAQFARRTGVDKSKNRILIWFAVLFVGLMMIVAFVLHSFVMDMRKMDGATVLRGVERRHYDIPIVNDGTYDPIDYWKPFVADAHEEFPLQRKPPLSLDKYITFEDDTGGWNNIRMAFEVFVVLAKVTGRILVLPPRCRFYLLDRGPITVFEKGKFGETSSYDDYYDFSLLTPHVQIITTKEFLDREKENIGIPTKLAEEASVPQLVSNGKHTDYFLWLRESKDAIMWPSGPAYKPDFDLESKEPIHAEKKLLHFPMHVSKGLRYLSGVPALFRKTSENTNKHIKRFVRAGLVYGTHIRTAAKEYVKLLGGFGNFISLHIRRNELQYKSVFITGDQSANNVLGMIPSGSTVYLATDEVAEGFFDAFRAKNVTILRMPDLRAQVARRMGSKLHPKFEGMVEQYICAAGKFFFGTPFSSYTAHIMRLRSYMHASNPNPLSRACLYHTNNYARQSDIDAALDRCQSSFRGEIAMAENL